MPPARAADRSRYDVFLSYRGRDRDVVEQIARRLEQEGFSPWLDVWSLTAGVQWHSELAAGLDASAACAVFIGPGDLGAWELQEVAVALDRAAHQPDFRIFPVLLDGVGEPFDPNALPRFLRTRTWVDLRGGCDDERAVVVRFVVTRKTLSSRVSLCVLPTETFDPSDQALRFFSRQLPGVPRLVRGWMDPRAGAVRVMMGSAGQGRMMYSWSAPERSRSALQAAAGAYDEIELRPAETIDTAAGAVACSPVAGGEGDGDAPPPARERDRGDSADELDLDEAEALGELVELSAFWSGDPRDPGAEEP